MINLIDSIIKINCSITRSGHIYCFYDLCFKNNCKIITQFIIGDRFKL